MIKDKINLSKGTLELLKNGHTLFLESVKEKIRFRIEIEEIQESIKELENKN